MHHELSIKNLHFVSISLSRSLTFRFQYQHTKYVCSNFMIIYMLMAHGPCNLTLEIGIRQYLVSKKSQTSGCKLPKEIKFVFNIKLIIQETS